MAKKSTNDKLNEILNSTEKEQTFEEELNAFKKAKKKLRRSSLYCGGARTRMPKVNHMIKKEIVSPFQLKEEVELPELPITTSCPPGAHNDLYRMVQFATENSLNDPQKAFMTGTSLTEGIQFTHQPPWYFGQNNKTMPADSHTVLSANRYGYRGSRDIRQFHTKPHESPTRTKNARTPAFLSKTDDTNEYAQPILAATINSVNGMESPKLWPQNTEYCSGYKHDQVATSSMYNRETTVGLKTRPKKPKALVKGTLKGEEEEELLLEFARMETRGTLQSAPMMSKTNCSATWNKTLKSTANSALLSTMNKESKPFVAHTLMNTTDSLRYSAGAASLLVRSQPTDEVRFQQRMKHSGASLPYQLRWKQLVKCFNNINSKLKRDQSMQEALSELGTQLRVAGTLSGMPTMIGKVNFIKTMRKNPIFECSSKSDLCLLFSVFDPLKTDVIRFVELIAPLVMLNGKCDSGMDKVNQLWKVHALFGNDATSFEICLNILTCCCASDAEHSSMEKLFKDKFRKAVYRIVLAPPSPLVKEPDRFDDLLDFSIDNTKTLEKKSNSPIRKNISVQPAYNVADAAVDNAMFLKVLRQEPDFVALFDAQLSDRLIDCYGVDVRQEVEAVKEDSTLKDFSWIISINKGK